LITGTLEQFLHQTMLGELKQRRIGTHHRDTHVTCHMGLPATRHMWTPASELVLDLPTPQGWKAELT